MSELSEKQRKFKEARRALQDVRRKEESDYGYEPSDRKSLRERMFDYERRKDKMALEKRREDRKARGKGKIAEGLLNATDALSRIVSSRTGGIRSDKPIDFDAQSYFQTDVDKKYEDQSESMIDEGIELESEERLAKESDTQRLGLAKAEQKAEETAALEASRTAKDQLDAVAAAAAKQKDSPDKYQKKLQAQLEKDREKANTEVNKITKEFKKGIDSEAKDYGDLVKSLAGQGITQDNPAFDSFFKKLKAGKSFWSAVPGEAWDDDKKTATKELFDSATLKKALQQSILRDKIMQQIQSGNPIDKKRVSGLGLELDELKQQAEKLGYDIKYRRVKYRLGSEIKAFTPEELSAFEKKHPTVKLEKVEQ